MSPHLRLKTALTVSASLLIGGALAGPAAAGAPPKPTLKDAVQHFGNMATGGCLDDSFAYGFRGFSCNGMAFQNWNVHIWGDGTRELKNLATGRCIWGGGAELSRPSTGNCDASKGQSWWTYSRGDQVSFQNQATGLCMDDSEYGLRMLKCNYNRYQTWR
ncbi:ricin-type beta-trefoil lectin domain protein [Spirillospora sp. NPDC052269]